MSCSLQPSPIHAGNGLSTDHHSPIQPPLRWENGGRFACASRGLPPSHPSTPIAQPHAPVGAGAGGSRWSSPALGEPSRPLQAIVARQCPGPRSAPPAHTDLCCCSCSRRGAEPPSTSTSPRSHQHQCPRPGWEPAAGVAWHRHPPGEPAPLPGAAPRRARAKPDPTSTYRAREEARPGRRPPFPSSSQPAATGLVVQRRAPAALRAPAAAQPATPVMSPAKGAAAAGGGEVRGQCNIYSDVTFHFYEAGK